MGKSGKDQLNATGSESIQVKNFWTIGSDRHKTCPRLIRN